MSDAKWFIDDEILTDAEMEARLGPDCDEPNAAWRGAIFAHPDPRAHVAWVERWLSARPRQAESAKVSTAGSTTLLFMRQGRCVGTT